MPPQVDQVADRSGAEFVRLSRLYAFPDFVKKADQAQVRDPGRLATSHYADPRGPHPQFPCHTAAATYVSCLFYQEKRAEFHPKDRDMIERRLDGYVRYWRIKSAVDDMKTRWREVHKSAEEQLPDSAFAYVWEGDGQKQRYLPLRSAAEVKAAAEWLETYRDRLPYSDRRVIANRVLEKAAHYGAAINGHIEFLERQAGRGVCDPQEVVRMIENRALLSNNDEVRSQFRKLAATIESLPGRALAPQMLIKLAETMDQLDRGLGIVGKYSETLPRYEDVLFKATFTKAAADIAQVVATSSGKLYDKYDFRKLAVADVKDLFGSEFVERVTTPLGEIDVEKMAEEVAALPLPDAALLDTLLGEQGVTPVMRKAASDGQGLQSEEMKAWAAAYATVPAR